MFVTLSKNFVPRILFTLVIALITIESTAQVNPVAVTTVSAASYERTPVAPESLVSGFGTRLSTATVVASDQNPQTPVIDLPTTLGGTMVQVNGVLAGILFVSPLQVNFVVPAGINAGTATVKILASDGTESNGTLEVSAFRPSLFTFNANGQGVLTAEVVRVKPNGMQSRETLATIDAMTNRYETKPIDLGPQGERVFLEIYLTGIRGSQDSNNDGNLKENVWVLVGGNLVLPEYAGRQPIFAGLDQVNVELSRTLIGAGKINLVVHERLGDCTACLSQPGVSSQIVELEIASATSATPPRITSLSAASVSVGDTLFINGSGYASNSKDNVVRIGGTRAKVQFATATQLTVPVPVGAKTGIVTVNTTQGEGRSSTELAIKTSIKGRVETGDPMNPLQPVPLANIKVSLAGTNISTLTNLQGVFSFQDVTAGNVELEFDSTTFPVQGLFSKVVVPMTVMAGRDNALFNSIWLTSNGNLPDAQTIAGAVVLGTFVEDDGSPIANAQLRMTGQRNYSAITDGNGGFVFRNVSAGDYVVTGSVHRPDGVIARVIQSMQVVDANIPTVINVALTAQEPNRPPVLITPKSVTMNINEILNVPIYAADPNTGHLISVSTSGPIGTSILPGTNGVYTIRLAPTSTGASTITVRATDTLGAQTTQSIEFKVNGANSAPTVSVPGAQSVKVGQTLSFQVSATDVDTGQTITLNALNMPQGATFTPASPVGTLTGTFSWTPAANQAGVYTVTFTAIDNGNPSLSDTKTVTITATQ